MVYRPLHFSTGGDPLTRPLVGLYPLGLHLHTQFVACMDEMVTKEKNSIKNESIVSRFLLRRAEILKLEINGSSMESGLNGQDHFNEIPGNVYLTLQSRVSMTTRLFYLTIVCVYVKQRYFTQFLM